MKIKHLFLLFILSLSGLGVNAWATVVPQYANYPVNTVYTGPKARLNTNSDPTARYFPGLLKKAYQDKAVNFAGHYILTYWHQGTAGTEIAILDTKTGKAYMPFKQTIFTDEATASLPDKPNIHSRLIILKALFVPLSEWGNKNFRIHHPNRPCMGYIYYRWKNNKLVLIKTVKNTRCSWNKWIEWN